MQHFVLIVTPAALASPVVLREIRLAREEGTWTWVHFSPTGAPVAQRVELEVGDATLAFAPEEFRRVMERLLTE